MASTPPRVVQEEGKEIEEKQDPNQVALEAFLKSKLD